VRRRGGDLVRATLTGLEDAPASELDLSPVWFNLKVIPSVVEGAPPDVAQLTATTFARLEATEVRRGSGGLRIGDGPDDPLTGLIGVREVLDGHRMTLSFDLLHGEVVHDYLDGESTTTAVREIVASR
jgi:acetoacetate decarboxylase